MDSRPATRADLPATVDLVTRSDTAWFGAPEHDESEVAEFFDQAASLGTDSRVFLDGDRIVAVALHNPTDSWFVTDPDPALTARVADDLIGWYAGFDDAHIDVLDRDEAMRAALGRHGWRHDRSTFDLIRAVSNDWVINDPEWPDGVALRDFSADHAPEVYHLIYDEARWADVPGHPHRDLESWRSIFITDSTVADQQVLAWRGDRPVGVSLGRIFSDGTGWVAQLAVATSERGLGLGRALLLETLRRRREAGATTLGLAVSADNRNALGLYLSTGLTIDREWMEYLPATR